MHLTDEKRTNLYWLLGILPFCLSAAFASSYLQAVYFVPLGLLFVVALVITVFFYPYIFFWGLLLLAPFNDHVGVNLGGLTVRSYTLFVLLILFWMAFRLTDKKINHEITQTYRLFWIYSPLLALSISKFVTLYALTDLAPGMTKFFSIKLAIVQIFLYIAALLTSAFLTTRERIYFFLKCLIYITNGILILGVLQIVISNVTPYHFVHHRDVIFFGRPFSVFREPDVFACFTASVFLIELNLLMGNVTQVVGKKTLIYSIFGSILFILILMVRAAWLASIVGFIFSLVCHLLHKKSQMVSTLLNRIIIYSTIAFTLLAIAFPSVIEKMADRLGSIAQPTEESASKYRKIELAGMIKHTQVEVWNEHNFYRYLFGYGDFSWSYWAPYLLGNDYDQDAKKNANKGAGVLAHPGFCLPIVVVHDNGVIGAFFYSFFMLSIFFKFFKLWKEKIDAELRNIALCAAVAVLSVLVCYIFSYDPIFPYFWSLIGLFWGIVMTCEAEKKAGTPKTKDLRRF